jgi:polysaccharide biosynthesis/export protein
VVGMRRQRSLQMLMCILIAGLTASAQGQDAPEYRLGAGDNIRISVFQNPNLSLETRVSEDGTINYPLIGLARIGGMTVARAEQTIAQALESGNYLARPQVHILPLQIRSSQVSVLGAVNSPGRFPMETFNTRVSEVIALAGGIATTGADVAILSGQRAGKPFRKEIDIPSLFRGNRQDDDLVVAAGDVIYVDRAPQFYVYGEVQKPGAYRLERGMTVRQALAQGGGLTQRGTERSLRLHRRNGGGQPEVITPKLDREIQADDVLHVGESLF